MPPPQGTPNILEGPGDYTVTAKVHSDTYESINPSQFNLNGKAVLVTGGSRGVGKETAISFAKAGASMIAIGARSGLDESAKDIVAAGEKAGHSPRVLTLSLDVNNSASVNAAVDEISKEFGRLDIVVNVAGVVGEITPIADSSPEGWWNTWDVNLRGTYLVVRACLPLVLKSSELKTFLTVSSVGALLVGPGLSAYQTSKLALLRFSEFIQAEYGAQGVIAISVHPGNILNAITDGIDEKLKYIFTETNTLPADTIVWLTAKNREWLNGRYVNCTWDMPQLEAKKEAIVKGAKLKIKLDVDI